MNESFWQGLAMVIYLGGMLLIGWWSYHRTHNLDDYMLGSRDLSPAVAALSAGAADMSGWLLMGLPGAIYKAGLVEGWIAVGLTVGAWLNWKYVAPRLRSYTQVADNSITVPSFLGNRLHDSSKLMRVVSGVIILVFFTFYVSSGMVAGGVFFQSSFGMEYRWGMLLVAAVTVTYTLFGGFLAVSYTDFVQGIMMVLALVLVPVSGIIALGGWGEFTDAVAVSDAQAGINRFAVLPAEMTTVAVIGIVSALAWGLGYFGQPHIIVRFMALRSVAEAKAGRRIGIGWMLFAALGAISTALVGAAYFQRRGGQLSDPETVYIRLGQIFFHPLIAGFMLAAVLAAIMSTISSQLLVTASALVEDVYKAFGGAEKADAHHVLMGRLAVLGVSVIAAAMAWNQNATILQLVAFAWAGFGAVFGPIVLLSLYWRRLTTWGALSGMISGAITVGVWGKHLFGKEGIFALYEILPGFLVCGLVAVVVSLATYRPDPEIDREFDEALKALEGFTAEENPGAGSPAKA
ncbi:sodium/proline symporter [Austwickia chelonae]|uniref:Sodium/proline symporter n=1 Tax=Austwickia chelonae NBRC 105200 TaxID=1184607 RepID=K6UN93_9MICO|nr:sodium/proline symporter PutP [Austwickia chelonae]GAB78786.1 putative sodium/proline symporter [Austwickia chelonae NBRC 105200]SEW35404.1 sodium/proline symporter [Austwickia chelonae]